MKTPPSVKLVWEQPMSDSNAPQDLLIRGIPLLCKLSIHKFLSVRNEIPAMFSTDTTLVHDGKNHVFL